jgi:ATP-dependent Clp protease protease subunit
MKIRLHGTILDEDSKKCEVMWFGESDSVSFKDLDEALASKADDDRVIELSINSPGGVCTEGMAIYDRLRSLEGHTIKAEVIGECSSMASVVLMAASVRRMHPNARICIHKPRFSDFYLPTMTEDEAKRAYEDLHAETERLKKIYLDRTSYTEEELDKLMGEDRYMTAEEALQHGVITEIIQPMTATKQPTHMSKLTKALKAFAQAMREGENEQETSVVAMTLNTEDGSTIEIERKEGEPQVGDKVVNTEDGEYKMADGTTIVIADGVITEIKPAEAEDNEDETMTEEEVASTIAEMTEAIEKLTAENESLKAQLAASKANEKTAEDVKALSLVAMVGGVKGLESLKSKYNPESREVKSQVREISDYDKRIAEKRKEINEKQQKNK